MQETPLGIIFERLPVGSYTDAGRDSQLIYVRVLLRKEVIQPQVPLRLPCYDFAPIADLILDSSLQKVRPLA